MLSENLAISVRNLTKTYRLFAHPGDRIKQAAIFGLRKYYTSFTALKDVSFEVITGEAVGIIGHNGSGKSTLLQLICGILKPTAGIVHVNGRISALLELGAGFNPEFTGRENVYFQGALQGQSKADMDERFDDIAAFADIGEFIDQPVRTYSSGMFVRLAFATGIHVSPDIMVIDEALSVGDEAFQLKCFQFLQGFRNNGGTVLFVSHNANMVASYCDRAVLLDQGRLVIHAEPGLALSTYRTLISEKTAKHVPADLAISSTSSLIDDPHFTSQKNERTDAVIHGHRHELVFNATFSKDAREVVAMASVRLKNGFLLGTFASTEPKGGPLTARTGETLHLHLPFLCSLIPGVYTIDCSLEGNVDGRSQCLGQVNNLKLHVVADRNLPAIGSVNFSPPQG